jgi:micrococcal nuclease
LTNVKSRGGYNFLERLKAHGTVVHMKYALILIGLLLTAFFGTDYSHAPKAEVTTDESVIGGTYIVLSVIDGDTLTIETKAGAEKVRLIGIDTPEMDPNRGGPECYGAEASKRTKELAEQQSVTIELDESQGTRDTYGRLLAYARLSDGRLLNEALVAEGYAREYTYNKPYAYQKELKSAEASARAEKKGLWGACSN